jgi:asparagine synthetase B (glutamine-hydrolysing)
VIDTLKANAESNTSNLPSFELEVANDAGDLRGLRWSRVGNGVVIVRHASFRPQPVAFEIHDHRFYILGSPIYNDKIDPLSICRDFAENYERDEWLAAINGEFVIIHSPPARNVLRIVNCRFGYPTIWYAELDNRVLISYAFSDLQSRLSALGRGSINEDSFFDFLRYKRVFGDKTPERAARLLSPAHVLTLDNTGLAFRRYWKPDFRDKLNIRIDEASELFGAAVQASIRRKTSDEKRYGLFLSGGMDTRLILSSFNEVGMRPPCFTINPFENREVQVAGRVADIIGAKHIFLRTPEGHYRKNYSEAVRLTSAMYAPMTMFHGHSKEIAEHIDVGFHGHGFDYMFQGMYVPYRHPTLRGRALQYRRRVPLPKDVVTYFLENISYRVKGIDVLDLAKPEAGRRMMERLREEIEAVHREAREICTSKTDIYEYFSFHNLARHYSCGDHWGINTNVEQRTVAFDNDIFDLYQKVPTDYRFDARIQRRCLANTNQALANLMSANTRYPIVLSSLGRTVAQLQDAALRRLRLRPKPPDNRFERMGLPAHHLVLRDLRPLVEEVARSDRLEALTFLDVGRTRAYVRKVLQMADPGYNIFIILLTCVDQFLKQTDATR